MGTEDNEIEALLQRARNGCPDAARQIVELCSKYVRSAVRYYLGTRNRSLFDSDDLYQDVWTIFFKGVLPTTSFDSVQHLRCYLQGMARKAVDHARRRLPPSDTHTVPQEQSLEEAPVRDGAQGDPAQAILVEDEWKAFLCREPRLGFILQMRRDGLTTQEIACILDASVRTTQRLIGGARWMFDRFHRRT
ncbi:MAG: hypothetical protein HYS12_11715 [Planctomycetes bacterium]|nr:hypothetical protein [Planctomycetota bacterium]